MKIWSLLRRSKRDEDSDRSVSNSALKKSSSANNSSVILDDKIGLSTSVSFSSTLPLAKLKPARCRASTAASASLCFDNYAYGSHFAQTIIPTESRHCQCAASANQTRTPNDQDNSPQHQECLCVRWTIRGDGVQQLTGDVSDGLLTNFAISKTLNFNGDGWSVASTPMTPPVSVSVVRVLKSLYSS